MGKDAHRVLQDWVFRRGHSARIAVWSVLVALSGTVSAEVLVDVQSAESLRKYVLSDSKAKLTRTDGENYNMGFVDVSDAPYPELREAARMVNEHFCEIRSARSTDHSQDQ